MWAWTDSPLACVLCQAPAQLKAPAQFEGRLQEWNGLFECIYRLWLDSGDYEAWAEGQLEDLASPINRQGRQLVSQLAEHFEVYYYCRSMPERQVPNCPLCGKLGVRLVQGRLAQAACKSCLLVWPTLPFQLACLMD